MKKEIIEIKKSEALPEALRRLPTGKLLDLWETTDAIKYTPELTVVRGWLLDELEIRNPTGFNAWLDQKPAAKDEDLRRFITKNSICYNCLKFGAECPGTTPQPCWTGCVYRRTK